MRAERYEARGTIVVTPPLAELHLANQRGDSLVSTRICNCADGIVMTKPNLLQAEAYARLIAAALNAYAEKGT